MCPARRCLLLICCLFLIRPPGTSADPADGNDPNAQRPQPARPTGADGTRLQALIRQLGSRNFKEREAASRALDGIGQPAIDALRQAAARDPDLEIRHRADVLVRAIENRLDQLLLDYRDHGLPLPPADAKLVRVRYQPQGSVNGQPQPPYYYLGFLLPPAAGRNSPRLLQGTWEIERADEEITALAPEHATLRDIEGWMRAITPSGDDGLFLSIQCHARGWHALAQAILDRWQDSDSHASRRSALACAAWRYWDGELSPWPEWGMFGRHLKPYDSSVSTVVTESSDWELIARHLKRLIVLEKRLDTRQNRALLKSLEAALVPSKAKPGSIAAMIDDLIQVADSERPIVRNASPDPRYVRLLDRGFKAVPDLIDHLDDQRLTRSVKPVSDNFPGYRKHVCDVVSDLLRGLSGEDLGTDQVRRQQGYHVARADALGWWNKARKMGEEAYLLAHVLPDGVKAEWPNDHMLRVIMKKYPQHLPKLYLTILDKRPKMQSWTVAEAITASSLPREKKLELFLHASRNANLHHRRAAFWELKELDTRRFVQLLIATLEALPRTPKEPYWWCPEASFAILVTETGDTRAWQTLLKVARRSDVGLRMEMLQDMDGWHATKHRQQRLQFLAAFLHDAAVRDVKTDPHMFEGPCAACDFTRLAVRDLAAMEIALLLGLPAQPKPEWTPEQWARLRAEVRKALEHAAKSAPAK